MGVVFHFNQSINFEYAISSLLTKFDAVLLAIGLQKAKVLPDIDSKIPEESKTNALKFLRQFNNGKLSNKSPDNILVIGGGNSAMDSARSAKHAYPDSKVVVSCIETKGNMPAFPEEINHAEKEGVIIVDNSYVSDIVISSEGKTAILFNYMDCTLLRNVSFDLIITAIGMESELEHGSQLNILNTDTNGRVVTKNANTSVKNLFVAGDIVSGNSMSIIGAIASGKRAVVGIRKALENYQFEYEGELALNKLNLSKPPKEFKENSIVDLDLINDYNLFQSCAKCNHCIDNFGCPAMVRENGKIIIDHKRCNLCGLCIDVCPNNAITWEVNEKHEIT
jgi:putative selenate reductase